MNNILKNVAILATASMIIGCSGENTGTTTLVPAPTVPVSYKVAGTVVDGPIYGAIVKIVDINDSSIVYGTTTTDEHGAFDINISGLPAIYRVIIEDGQDSGVDTEVDSNDENSSFDMSATVKREENNETNTSVANVSPASTLVDKIVESGEMPLEDAQKSVAKSFGIDENTSFSKLDMRKHSVGNKIGNLVAFFVSIAPLDNKDAVIKALAQMVQKNDMNISINDLDTNLDEFNLSTLFAHIKNEEGNDSISPNDEEKILKLQAFIKNNLIVLLSNVKVADTISEEEKKEALSHKLALDKFLEEINTLTSDELDEEALALLTENIQEMLKAFLDDTADLNTSSTDNIDFLTELIKANLNLNMSEIKEDILKASQDYRKIIKAIEANNNIKLSHRVKRIIKSIYKNTSIDKCKNIKDAIDDEVLEEISKTADAIEEESGKIVETGEMPTEFGNELEDTVAGVIAKKLEDNASDFNASSVEELTKDTVKNPELIETLKVNIRIKIKIKTTKTKLTPKEKREFFAVKQVLSTIKVNVKIKKFTQVSADNANKYYNSINSIIETGEVSSVENLIQAFSLLLVNLQESFDAQTFENNTKETVKVIIKVKDKKTCDRVKSISNIKIKIQYNFVINLNTMEDILTDIDDSFDDLTKPIEIKARTFYLPQPRLDNAPKEFSTPIKIEI